jgi:hypothetical protein
MSANDEGTGELGYTVWSKPDFGYVSDEARLPVRDAQPDPMSTVPWRRVPKLPIWPAAVGPTTGAIRMIALDETGQLETRFERGAAVPPPGAAVPTPAEPLPDGPRSPDWAARAWVALAAIAVLVLTVAAGFALRPPSGKPRAAAATATAAHVPAAVTNPTVAAGTPAAAAGSPATTVDPAQPGSAAPSRPGTVDVTYEAEAASNTLSGGAFVASYQDASGGRIVKNIGVWNPAAGVGSLTFTNVAVPVAGTYTLTFYYVHVNGDPIRTVVITASGSDPVSVVVSSIGATCCARHTIRVHLAAGRNTISFGNQAARAPAIDKMVIAQA